MDCQTPAIILFHYRGLSNNSAKENQAGDYHNNTTKLIMITLN